jgi:SAM-dependent methyltransferase
VNLEHTHFDEAYYRTNGQYGDRPALRYYTRLMARYVGPGRVLDFGCGTGHLVRRLSALGRADGFEVSEYSAEQARRTAPGAQIFTDAAKIPTSAYHGLTAIHVVEHLADSDLAAALRTWRRILAPGGRILVVTPDLAGFGRALAQDRWNGFSDPTHINLKAHSDWKLLLEDNGFTVLREGSDGLWDVPYGRLPRVADAALHAVPAFTQYLSGRLLLRPGTGESSIFIIATRG